MSYRRSVRICTLDGEEKGGREIVHVVGGSDCAIERGGELLREQMYDQITVLELTRGQTSRET